MLSPQMTGSHSPTYYQHLERINSKYYALNRQVLRTGNDMHQYGPYNAWFANSVPLGVMHSLDRLEQDRQQALDELLAAERNGHLSHEPGASSFADYSVHQSILMPVCGPMPSHHTGMIWGPPAASVIPGTLSEPFMDGQRPVIGQDYFTTQGGSARSYHRNNMATHPANDAPTPLEYLYGVSAPPGTPRITPRPSSRTACAAGTTAKSRSGVRESISQATLSGTTLVGRRENSHSTASGAPSAQRGVSAVSGCNSIKTSPSETSSARRSNHAPAFERTRAASSRASSLTATWVDETNNPQSMVPSQLTDEATTGGSTTQLGIYAESYPLSTSSTSFTPNGRPTSVLTSNISPEDSISQHDPTTTSMASTLSIPTKTAASGTTYQTHTVRRSLSNCSRPSQARGSVLSPIAEASDPSSRQPSRTGSSCQSQGCSSSSRGKQGVSTSTEHKSNTGTNHSETSGYSQADGGVASPLSSSGRSASIPSSEPSAKSNPTSSSSGHLSTPYMAYAGTTMETDELQAMSPARFRAIARANAFESVLLVAVTATLGNAELRERLKRHEGRFHYYNALHPEPDFDGREFTLQERLSGRARHFEVVRIVALTRRGGSDELPREIAEKVERFKSLNILDDENM